MTPSASTLRARERAREWARNNRDRYNANMRRWSAENPEKKKLFGDRWKKANKERCNEQRRVRRAANPHQMRDEMRKWRAENPERNREYGREYNRRRRASSPIRRLEHSFRERTRKALRGAVKSEAIVRLLGISIEGFKAHLEKQFRPGMSWENYGFRGWHVDHIRPLSSFDLSDPVQQAAAFHYINTQPLWMAENFSKHTKHV